MAIVYILKSEKAEKTYTGSTTDLDRRLHEHNNGRGTFSSRYTPWKVVYTEECNTIEEAREREQYLKSAAGRKYIRKHNLIPQ